MAVPPEALAQLSRSVQPLVFETGIDEFPYMTLGTVFLVGFEGRAFVLTTRYSLNPENLGPICVFPSDSSRRVLPLKDVFFVSRNIVSEDFVDLAVIEIDMAKITNAELGQASLIDLALASGDWLSRSEVAEFIVLGYPEEHSFVDYDCETLSNGRVMLRAIYIRQSVLPYLHEIEVLNTDLLSTFNGFSGSPVFAWVQHDASRPEIILCGMVIRGTATSSRIHFLDRSVLLDALKVKRAYG